MWVYFSLVGWIPIFVRGEDISVLVIGGGEEGTKKALRMARSGAKVTVYSMDFTRELVEYAGRYGIRLVVGDVKEPTVLGLIEEADLIIYTVPGAPERAAELRAYARKLRRIFVDSTDIGNSTGAVGLEASVDYIKVGVFTHGRSSLVSKEVAQRIREWLEGQLDVVNLGRVLGEVKARMKAMGLGPHLRVELHRLLFRDPHLRDLAMRGDVEHAIEYAMELVKRRVAMSES